MCRDRGVSRHAWFETLRVLVQKTSEKGRALAHKDAYAYTTTYKELSDSDRERE